MEMRLFIGINFSEATSGLLAGYRDDLRAKSKSGSFTLTENIHLTLVFLGECSQAQKRLALSAMDEVNFKPFDTEIDRLGRFRRGDGDIWWAGLKESKALIDLQANLAGRLKACGFSLESRKYSPHITLARRVITDEKPRAIALFGETVTKIELIESKRINGKLTYIPI
jgi:2'-5' RNA ligase